MFNLKKFREDSLKLSQEQLADLIDIRQDKISRLEKNPKTITLPTLQKIAEVSGVSLDQLINFKLNEPQPIFLNDTWQKEINSTKKNILTYLKKSGEKYIEEWGKEYLHFIEELKSLTYSYFSKPKIAVVGNSDVGKSRLINALLGPKKILPTSWTPTTSIAIYIKHIDDRPAFINDDVWFFKASNDNMNWNVTRFRDEDYCKSQKVASGNTELLHEYAIRQSEKNITSNINSAIVFLDSNILQNCDIIDLPGYNTGDRIEDDIRTMNAKEYADILIYISIANGFLRGNELDYLKEGINALPVLENIENKLKPFSNLFILASQSHVIAHGNKNDLFEILDRGCDRLNNSLTRKYWENKSIISDIQIEEYNKKALRSRFFTYTTDIDNLRQNFESDIKFLLEKLPAKLHKQCKDNIKNYIQERVELLENKIKHYKHIQNKQKKDKELLKKIQNQEPERKKKRINLKNNLNKSIKFLENESIDEFKNEYNSIISIGSIARRINNKNHNKKKEGVFELVSVLNSTLQKRMEDILKDKSKKYNESKNEFFENFSHNIHVDTIDSDFHPSAFSSSDLVSMGLLRGLNIAAARATAAAVTDAAGSDAVATDAKDSIIFHLRYPTPMLSLIMLPIVEILHSKRGGIVPDKIVKEINTSDTLSKYQNYIKKYWDDIRISFNSTVDDLEKKWRENNKELNSILKPDNTGDIERKIKKIEGMKSFLNYIPL